MAKEPDPRAELAQLESELAAGGALAPAYVLRGAERWFRERALDRLVERARAAEFEVCRHDARDPNFRGEVLLDDLAGSALFASARLVIVSEPEALLKRSESGDDSTFVRAARKFVQGKRGTLVLAADSLRSDLVIVKDILAAGGKLASFRRLYERPPAWSKSADPRSSELVEWLLARAAARRIALTPDQAVVLAHAQGNFLAELDDQLTAVAAGGAGALLARLASQAAGAPSDVADALLGGETGRAVLAISTLFEGGMRKDKDGGRETKGEALSAVLLGYLRPRVRSGLAAAAEVALGKSAEEAASAQGVAPFDRTLRGAIAWRAPREWNAMQVDLLELERASRRGVRLEPEHFVRLALRWSKKAAARAR